MMMKNEEEKDDKSDDGDEAESWPFPLCVVSFPVGVDMRSNWDNFMSLAMLTPLCGAYHHHHYHLISNVHIVHIVLTTMC